MEIDRDHWNKIVDVIIESFSEEKKEDTDYYGRFMHLLKLLHEAKKEGLLPYSNSKRRIALEKLIETGFLIKNSDGSYRLIDDYEKNRESYIEIAIKG